VTKASSALQALQDEFERDSVAHARVRFPRGFIRTASELRATLPQLGTEVQRRNASYALMTLDVFRWLVVRTDLSGAALSMIVKEGTSLIGALCEWLTKEGTRGHASNRPYAARTQKLVELGHIDASLKVELDWVWDIRCNEHLHEVASLEHVMYSKEHYNRALRAYRKLRDALVKLHGCAG
jgi:hypothetical protein